VYNNQQISTGSAGLIEVHSSVGYEDDDSLRFVDCEFADNLMVDYSESVGEETQLNEGRVLDMRGAGHLLLHNCRFVNNRLDGHIPEQLGEPGSEGRMVGSTVEMELSGYDYPWTVNIEDCLMQDCDDGGFWIHNTGHTLIRNMDIIDVNRFGLILYSSDSADYRVENVFIKGIQAQDMYIPYPYDWSVQSALWIMSELPSFGRNVTIVDCDVPYLLHGGHTYQEQTYIENSIMFDNDFVALQKPEEDYYRPIIYNYCLGQEELNGTGNLVADPLFHSELGAPFLAADSPCIDAGDPDQAFNDIEDPNNPGFALWPSQGGLRNDMGYTGGPHARIIEFVDVSPGPDTPSVRPQRFILRDPYPNPFNPVTHIPYSLGTSADIELVVYDILGCRVRTLIDARQPAGEYIARFHSNGLASGVYFVHMSTDRQQETKKIILLR